MHAAVDAMRPMGFPADVVRKCVKKLLKVCFKHVPDLKNRFVVGYITHLS